MDHTTLTLLNVLLLVGGIALAFAFVVFLLFREFFTWYWKQTEQVKLLKEIAESLRRLEGRPDPDLAPQPVAWWERVADRLS